VLVLPTIGFVLFWTPVVLVRLSLLVFIVNYVSLGRQVLSSKLQLHVTPPPRGGSFGGGDVTFPFDHPVLHLPFHFQIALPVSFPWLPTLRSAPLQPVPVVPFFRALVSSLLCKLFLVRGDLSANQNYYLNYISILELENAGLSFGI
jgi:hypothetical protein